MRLEDPEALTAAHIPQPDRLIIAATGQQGGIWAEGHRTDQVGMALQRAQALTGVHIPQFDDVVARTAGEQHITRAEDSTDQVGMALQLVQALIGAYIPQLDDGVTCITGEQHTIRAEGSGHDPVGMTQQRRKTMTGARIPHFDALIAPSSDQQRTIETKGKRQHPTRVSNIYTGLFSRGGAPPAYFSARCSCHQKLPIRAERHTTDIAESLGKESVSKVTVCKAHLPQICSAQIRLPDHEGGKIPSS